MGRAITEVVVAEQSVRRLRALLGVTALAWAFFALREVLHHAVRLTAANAIGAVLFALLWLRVRAANAERVAHLALAVAVSVLIFSSMLTGQGGSRAAWFLVATPLFAAQSLGRRATITWGFVAASAMVAINVSEHFVVVAPEVVVTNWELTLARIAVLAIAFAFAATARRVHEAELAARTLVAGRLSAVLDSLPEGVCFVAKAGERIANRQLTVLFDLDPATVPTIEAIAERTRDPKGLLRTHAALREGNRRTLGVIVELANGRILELDFVPIEAEGGELWAFRDVTERTIADRVKSDFLSIVSHELRTPLTAIHGAVRMLESDVAGPIDAEAKTLLAIASSNTSRLRRVVDDLLDLQRLEAGRLALHAGSVDLVNVLERVVERQQREAKKTEVRLTADLAALPRIPGEDGRLEQVFSNLIGNAIKFSPRAGVVEIRAIAKEGKVRVEVSDQGPGISDTNRRKIFEKFVQLEGADTRHKGGTGMGLAIAKGIVESHGGAIGLDPRRKGSTFWVELPALALDPARPQ